MRLRGAIVVVAVLLCTASSALAGEWMFQVNAGGTFPNGDLGSTTPPGLGVRHGPQAGFEVSYRLKPRLVLGVDGSWAVSENDIDGLNQPLSADTILVYNRDRTKIGRLGAHAQFLFPGNGRAFVPYGVVGLGLYNMKRDYEHLLNVLFPPNPVPVTVATFTDESDNYQQPGSRMGGRIGLGALIDIAETSIDLRADYHMISMDKDKTGISSARYVGLQVGIVYRLRT